MMSSMSYVEIHFHLLPGVDDGPATVEQSLALARAAVADGAGTIVCTPHVHPLHITDPIVIHEHVAALAARLRRERVALELRAGGELADGMVQRLSQRQLESIAHGPPGRRWVLLEAPFRGMDDEYRAAAEEVRARGLGVVVGHPERAMDAPSARAVLDEQLGAGSALQLNAWSLTGGYGERIRAIALGLLRTAPRVAIASDAHGRDRLPWLGAAVEALTAAGERDPRRFASSAPRALLERGLALPPAALVA
jgi:protein-tyrosine phosphatase